LVPETASNPLTITKARPISMIVMAYVKENRTKAITIKKAAAEARDAGCGRKAIGGEASLTAKERQQPGQP
jgi:hypothetical protein